MSKPILALALLTVLVAIFLRFFHYANRAPFDWDQNRDYGEVKKIAAGQYVPLGPIAKGSVGGFYLGSLYYYLLFPAYGLTSGSLTALPVTSILLDCLMVIAIFLLLSKIIGGPRALGLTALWASSWFLIEASKISWNVALLPLWSLGLIYAFHQAATNHSRPHLYLLGLLAGLALHIHVTALPLIPLLLLLYLRRLSFPLAVWIKAGLLALLPALPLIHYDLTHAGLNLHLLNTFLRSVGSSAPSLPAMTIMALTKLGKVVSGLLFARFVPSLPLGVLTFALALSSVKSKLPLTELAGLHTLILLGMIIGFRDYNFPEYYFVSAYLSIFLLYTQAFLPLFVKVNSFLPSLVVILIVLLNLRAFTTLPTGFSLGTKTAIVDSLKIFDQSLDLHYAFDPGRDGGLRYLVERAGLRLDPHARTRILLTDKQNTPLYIEGELTRDLTQLGNLRTALYIVQ